MNIKELEKEVKKIYETEILHFSSNYFGDEAVLVYDDEEYNVIYRFLECYKVNIEHEVSYKKNVPYKELITNQIPFFIQRFDFTVKEGMYKFKINAYPLDIEIWCKEIEVQRVLKGDYDCNQVNEN